MTTVLLVVHLLIAAAMVGVILIQRSEGGALGGLGGGTMGGMMTARGTANLLTRTTAILAACFIGTSLALAILASHEKRGGSLLDRPVAPAEIAGSGAGDTCTARGAGSADRAIGLIAFGCPSAATP